MKKHPQHVTRKTHERGGMSVMRHAPRSLSLKATAKRKKALQGRMTSNQLEAIFECLPESIIVCNQEEKILRINAAALKLFEVPSEDQYRGTFYQQFLQHYTSSDKQPPANASEQWLLSLIVDESATVRPPEKIIELKMPSGSTIYVNQRKSTLLDRQAYAIGVVYTFTDITHCYQKAFHLQRVHEALQTLVTAIAHIPEHYSVQVADIWPQGSRLFSPPVVFIAQQLVDVIRQVLSCQRVSLKALGPTGRYYYLAGSGFLRGQEQPEQKTSGHFTFPEVFGETLAARLAANQEVMMPASRVHLPPGFGNFASENLLLVPLFLEQQLVGVLTILKAGGDSIYTPEEIELVRAVATLAELMIECLGYLQEQAATQSRAQILHEVERLSNNFLILASHELRTPLTGVLGNLQLAQRRIELLRRQAATQSEHVGEQVAQVQQPLASATQSAQLEQRMIADIIDATRLQANQLEVYVQQCDLLALIKEAIARQQRLVSEQRIVLDYFPKEQHVPIMADPERINQVFTIYLTNALTSSPTKAPVTVQVKTKDLVVRVSVHNEGAGIPIEEHPHLWERFYHARWGTVQHELDLSLGLGLYLCRALIERHGGHVGLQSTPGQGATFWFTLPMLRSPGT